MSDMPPVDVTERDVYVTRAFDAPRDLVWRFFTEPELVAKWFGPDDFHVPVDTVSITLEVGGEWNLSMIDDASGNAFPIRGVITQCEPPEYLEIRLGAHTDAGELENVMLRLRFHDHGEKTRVTLHQGPFDDVQREQTEAGWEESFVKLDGIFADRA